MQRRILVGFIVSLCVGIAAYFFVKSKSNAQPISSSPFQVTVPDRTKVTAIASRVVTLNEMKFEGAVPEICRDQWTRVTQLDAARFAEDLYLGNWQLNPDCKEWEKKMSGNIPDEVYKVCGQTQDEDTRANCYQWALTYRAHLISLFSENERNFSQMALELLMNKIMARLSSKDLLENEKNELLQMVEELITREPDMIGAYKAYAAAYLATDKITDPKLRAAIDRANEIDRHDVELQEAKLLVDTIQEGLPKIEEYIEANPDSGLGYYYLAGAYWKAGNREAAIGALQTAVELAPEDMRFREILERARRTQNTNEKIFVISFSSPFNDL